MQVLMKVIYFTFLYALLPKLGYGQQQDMMFSQEVVNLFSNYERGIWLSHFAGMNSRAEPVVITLGHDRQQFKGILYNVQRNDKSFLEGSFSETDIRLVQMDSTESLVGYLQGELESQHLLLEYLNRKKDKGEILKLTKIDRSDFKFSKCPIQMWYTSFLGEWEKSEVILQIQKEEDQSIYGAFSIPSKKQGYLLKGTCSNSSCNQIEGKLIDFNGKIWKDIHVTLKDSSTSIQVKLSSGKHSPPEYSWNKQFQKELTCINIQQVQNSVYASYINLGDRNFDKWINEKMLIWQNQYTATSSLDEIENRFQRYIDIEWITEAWVSGIIISKSTWTDSIQYEAFIYDLNQNRPLDWSDIFIKEFNYIDFFNHWKASQKKEWAKVYHGELGDWIQNDPFALTTLRPEGICFTSAYNPIWGVRKIVLPISEVKSYFRKYSPFKNLN